LWAEKKSSWYGSIETSATVKYKCVCAGIVGDVFVCLHNLLQRLTEHSYQHFSDNNLPMLLHNVPLAIREEMWVMPHGVPSHFSLTAWKFLGNMYPVRSIDRREAIA
jgi:hypothetical protein